MTYWRLCSIDSSGSVGSGTGNASAGARYGRQARIESFYGLAGGLAGTGERRGLRRCGVASDRNAEDRRRDLVADEPAELVVQLERLALELDEGVGAAVQIGRAHV